MIYNLMLLNNICEKIDIPKQLIPQIIDFAEENQNPTIKKLILELTEKKAKFAYEKLSQLLEADYGNIKMLACYLIALLTVKEKYDSMGISEKIFFDTMGCFSRFIGECLEKTGNLAFDRAWWTYRQSSMVLFRIGQLEYEFLEEKNIKTVSIHIPSDAILDSVLIDDSFLQAKIFIQNHFPTFNNAEFICDSWLLSPRLKELLNENSKIIAFQRRFEIKTFNTQDKDFFEWVFKVPPETDYSLLSEKTSLQRKIKQLLLQNENIGSGYGVLKT